MLDAPECETDPGYGRDCHRTVDGILDFLDREEAMVEPAVNLAVRFWRGMADHFRLRAASWIMSVNMLVFGLTILGSPEVLTLPGRTTLYASLLHLASARTVGLVCLGLGGFRLLALAVNGTIPSFKASPYVRAIGSFLACLFWLQVVLGALRSPVWTLSLDVFTTYFVLDAFCLYIAALEIEPHGDGRA